MIREFPSAAVDGAFARKKRNSSQFDPFRPLVIIRPHGNPISFLLDIVGSVVPRLSESSGLLASDGLINFTFYHCAIAQVRGQYFLGAAPEMSHIRTMPRMMFLLCLPISALAFALQSYAAEPALTAAPARKTAQAQAAVPTRTDEKPVVDAEAIEFSGQIDVHVVAGGGGTSSGGGFSLSGTVGQAAAGGSLTNSTLAISSGFWNSVGTTSTPVTKRRGQVTSQ